MQPLLRLLLCWYVMPGCLPHVYQKKGVSSNRDAVDLHWVMGCSVLPGHHHILCFTGVQQKVDHWTPSNQFLDVLSICCHISTTDERWDPVVWCCRQTWQWCLSDGGRGHTYMCTRSIGKDSTQFPHDFPATISPLLALNVHNIH